jgi:hypothetical protein
MSDERKKPLWPWIVALLIGLPVMYVASFGPACWWFSKEPITAIDPFAETVPAVARAYWPIGWSAKYGPSVVRNSIAWYATLFSEIPAIAVPTDLGGGQLILFAPSYLNPPPSGIPLGVPADE